MLVFVDVCHDFVVTWSVFRIVLVFLSFPPVLLIWKYSHEFYILLHKKCLLLYSFLYLILLFPFYYVCFLESRCLVNRWNAFLDVEYGVAIFGFFCSCALLISVDIFVDVGSDVAPGGILYIECNYWFLSEYFSKTVVIFNMLMIFFLK